MTRQEYINKTTLLANRLQEIAELTERMAWVGSAHPNNPTFCDLMAAQADCLKKADELLEKYKKSQTF